MKSLKALLVVAAIICSAISPWMCMSSVAAASVTSAQGEVCQGLGEASGSCSTNQGSDLSKTMTNVVNILGVAAGFIAIIMLIISGIRFMTAAGDPSGIASARQALIYALVGIVVVGLSQIIVHFVFGRLTGTK